MSASVAEAAHVIAAYLEALADRKNARAEYRERFVAAVESLFTDSREARIEAEAVTDAECCAVCGNPLQVVAYRICVACEKKPKDLLEADIPAYTFGFDDGWEAARKARASNPPAADNSTVGLSAEEANKLYGKSGPRETAPQPAPDRVSRVEAALDTLFAAVGLAPDGMDSAWIAAAKAWNREGE